MYIRKQSRFEHRENVYNFKYYTNDLPYLWVQYQFQSEKYKEKTMKKISNKIKCFMKVNVGLYNWKSWNFSKIFLVLIHISKAQMLHETDCFQ